MWQRLLTALRETRIVLLINKTDEWIKVKDGIEAKQKADEGFLAIVGIKGADYVPSQAHGHVAIVVSNPLDSTKYPSA